MKLYYSPHACSLSPHIVLREIGAAFDLVQVDLASKQTVDGRDFLAINPKGQIPALELDDGAVLTEGVAIAQYLADTHPNAGLIPAAGTIERARVQETLNFVSSELHKAFGPLFNPATAEDGREAAMAQVSGKLDLLEAQLADGREWLAGATFSPADTYAFVVTRWTGFQGIALDRWPHVQAWLGRVEARPAVQAALAAEG